jgi:hypothetical protein
MKHLDPKQLPDDAPARTPKKRNTARNWLAAAVLVLLGAGAGLNFMFPTDVSDAVSGEEVSSRQAAYSQTQPLTLATVADAEIDAALDDMQLSAAEKVALRGQLGQASPSAAGTSANRPLKLARVTVWDTHAQDGDVVAVVSAGYRREVFITKAPQEVIIPVDGAQVVQLVGIRDGGGGITLGATGSSSSILMPIMSVGQTITLPVGF